MPPFRERDEQDDDAPVGRVLTRRELVRLLALSGAAVAAGCGRGGTPDTAAAAVDSRAAASATSAMLPACVVKPELTVGPYFVDKQLERSDIRVEPSTAKPVEGVPLALTFNVSRIDGGACAPLAGAMVDVWHCDARGVYSAVNDPMSGHDTSKEKYCRGYQITDAKGVARFTTIYPGWYRGRTVHIHFKIRTPAAAALADRTADSWEFTSQLFFDESLSDRIFANAPYVSSGARDTRNATDGIFQDSDGQLVLAVAPSAPGYAAAFDIGLDLSNAKTGKAERSGGPDGFGPPDGRGAPPGGRRSPPPGGRPPGGPPPNG